METKTSKEKFLSAKLEFLNSRPLIDQACRELNKEWMELVIREPD